MMFKQLLQTSKSNISLNKYILLNVAALALTATIAGSGKAMIGSLVVTFVSAINHIVLVFSINSLIDKFSNISKNQVIILLSFKLFFMFISFVLAWQLMNDKFFVAVLNYLNTILILMICLKKKVGISPHS